MAATGTVAFAPPMKKKAVIEPTPAPTAIPALNQSAEAKAQAAELTKVHEAFATKFAADQKAAQAAASSSTASYAGFGVGNISAFFGIDPVEALNVINQANAGEGLDAKYQAGIQHLAEHPAGSHYTGDFNATNALARAGAAVASGGTSELNRDKPFQPGGGKPSLADYWAPSALTKGGLRLLKGPNAPEPATPAPAPDQAAARQALDKADIERRKQLATSTNFTSVLGLPGDATVKRSVLG